MTKRMTDLDKLNLLAAYDNQYWDIGQTIIGMDEAGRGPLAGPVVAAAVVMPPEQLVLGVYDSKKISEKKREILFERITQTAEAVGVGIVDAKTIDEFNILNATRMAFKKAYDQIFEDADIVLSDEIQGLDIEGYIPIKKGDATSYSVAAASIVAKVTRDRLMRDYDKKYLVYGFSQHKGYGTKAHVAAILQHGACPLHRRSFLTRIIGG